MPIVLLISILSGCAWISSDEHTTRTDPDQDGVPSNVDCEDEDSAIGGPLTWYPDNDGDGYGDSGAEGETRCDGEDNEVSNDLDCDDTNSDIHENAIERCNDDIDNNCDGKVDKEPDEAQRWYRDVDGDGWGDSGDPKDRNDCLEEPGYVLQSGDCNDYNGEIYPGAEEYCDDEDTDCDEDTRDPHSVDAPAWYPDSDGDGFGDMTSPDFDCDQPQGLLEDGTDCDDSDETINPNGQEVCDDADVDEDCDELIDDADDSVDITTYRTLYEDADNDGFGQVPLSGCDPQEYQASNAGDCDDTRPDISPAGIEVCDENDEDEDCDGLSDDDDDSLDPTSAIAHYADSDGDGYGDTTAVFLCNATSEFPTTDNTDCDDTRADISPGGLEVCDDLDVDEDCDGTVDGNDSNVDPASFSEWYQDGDGDGYGSTSTPQTSCDPPAGYGAGTGDCDDSDPSISPAATEIWYDGTDQDCDAMDDYDADGDTYRSDSHPDLGGSYGTDCDDTVAMINPGLNEICNDGWDNDCDASTDIQCGLQSEIHVSAAEASFVPDSSNDAYGTAVDGGQDINQDGFFDIVIGAPGSDAAYVFLGPQTGSPTMAVADVRISGAGGWAGSAVRLLGDVTGDGISDIGVGAYKRTNEQGSAYIVDGTRLGNISLVNDDAATGFTIQFYGSASGDMLGYSMADAGDYNADGSSDWLVGAPAIGSGAPGEVYLLYGPLGSTDFDQDGVPDTSYDITMTSGVFGSSQTLLGEQVDDQAGYAVDGCGDIDGDGISDIIIGAPSYDDNTASRSDVGRAYVVPGSSGPLPPINLSDGFVHQLEGDSSYSGEAGSAVAGSGDVNADGYLDVLIGAYKENDPSLEAGTAYLVLGPIISDFSLPSADAKLTGASVTGHLGTSVDGAGDVNADGFDDVIVGAKDEDIDAQDSGAVYVVYGPVSGTVQLGSYDPRLVGESNHHLGAAISGVGDTNGNGFDDVLVGTGGDPSQPRFSAGEGAFLLLGGDI